VDFKGTYDSTAGAGVITQKGWLKSLYDPSRKTNYDGLICDLDSYLAIQNRVGRPVMFDATANTSGNVGNMGTYGLNVDPNLLNWSVGVPRVLIVPSGLWQASAYLLVDSRYALARVRNASASYSAVEQMVMQRSSQMRFDWSEMVHRLMPEDQGALKFVDFTNDA
jgi:hypothetical protein